MHIESNSEGKEPGVIYEGNGERRKGGKMERVTERGERKGRDMRVKEEKKRRVLRGKFCEA